MQVTKKLYYGILVAQDLAKEKQGFRSARAIAERLGITETAVRQALITLRKAGLLEAEIGREGGYKLAKPPETISLISVLQALTDGEPLIAILGRGRRAKPVEPRGNDPTARFWDHLEGKFWASLKDKTIADLL